jgi:hypothetical protein
VQGSKLLIFTLRAKKFFGDELFGDFKTLLNSACSASHCEGITSLINVPVNDVSSICEAMFVT